MMGYYGSNGWHGWMGIAMWIWPLVLGLAVWALVALTRDRRPPARGSADDPKDILKRRFARGEIPQEQYLEAVAILENGNSRAAHR